MMFNAIMDNVLRATLKAFFEHLTLKDAKILKSIHYNSFLLIQTP